MVRFSNVSKLYGEFTALVDVSFYVEPGEFVFVVGPSGAGKSTVVRLIYREVQPTRGRIWFNNEEITRIRARRVPRLRRRIGVVFQDFKLLPGRTVFHNVAYAMLVTEAPRSAIRRRVPEVLELVGLRDKASAYPEELSGGEQQRVALARAIVNEPLLIVADEPTGNLDPATSWQVVKILREINDKGTTVIMATHDQPIVNAVRRRVISLHKGRVVRDQERGLYALEG